MLQNIPHQIYLIWVIHTGMTQKDQGMTPKDPYWLQKYMFCTKYTLQRKKYLHLN